MKPLAYKQGIFRILQSVGFRKHGEVLRRNQDGVTVLISIERGLADQWHINVGFWLDSFGSLESNRVESTHFYCRLERLVPFYRNTILASGDLLASDQSVGYDKLLTLLTSEIDKKLQTIGTEQGLRAAIRDNTLPPGLLRAEARAYLDQAC